MTPTTIFDIFRELKNSLKVLSEETSEQEYRASIKRYAAMMQEKWGLTHDDVDEIISTTPQGLY